MHAVLRNVVERVSQDLNGLDLETTHLCPGQRGGQNAQQVVEVLVKSYRSTAEKLEYRLKQGRVTRKQRRSRLQWLLQIMVLGFGHIPEGSEFPSDADDASVHFSPMNGRDLLERLEEEFAAMDLVLDRCRSKFGMERVAVHPLLGPLRVDQWRRLHAVHTLHCCKQLRWTREFNRNAASPTKLSKELHIPAHRSLT